MRPELEAVWQRVVESWDDPARHDAFLGMVTQYNAFAWAAGKYREKAKEKAGDALAEKQLERIRKAAMATMLASATQKRGENAPYKSTIVIFLVLLLMLLIGLVGVKIMHDTRPHTEPAPRAPHRAQP